MDERTWGVTQFGRYVNPDVNDKLNDVEQRMFDICPALQRIATAQKPVALQGYIRAAHNPDAILLDSIFIELKGHVRSVLYRPMISQFPDWLKRRYHLMVCNSSAKERERMMTFCKKHGISASEGTTVPPWLVQRAIDLGSMQNDPTIHWLP